MYENLYALSTYIHIFFTICVTYFYYTTLNCINTINSRLNDIDVRLYKIIMMQNTYVDTLEKVFKNNCIAAIKNELNDEDKDV